jgi:hypothetical protein
MSSWTPEQLDALNAEAEHKQRMEDAGVDPGIPAEREAWEAGTTGGHSPSDWHASLPYEDGETPYARWLREMQLMELAGIDPANAPLREAWQQAMAAPAETGETAYGRAIRARRAAWNALLETHECQLRTCVYCGVPGLAEHFESVNGRNWACKQGRLCDLRYALNGKLAQGLPDNSVVYYVQTLVRELAQVARDDRAAAGHLPDPWGRHDARQHRTLSTRDLAALHVTLTAAAGWLQDAGRADWGQALAQARALHGCKRCGAMGPQPCTTDSGAERRSWHQGRAF